MCERERRECAARIWGPSLAGRGRGAGRTDHGFGAAGGLKSVLGYSEVVLAFNLGGGGQLWAREREKLSSSLLLRPPRAGDETTTHGRPENACRSGEGREHERT